jgi:hypothetical protein
MLFASPSFILGRRTASLNFVRRSSAMASSRVCPLPMISRQFDQAIKIASIGLCG